MIGFDSNEENVVQAQINHHAPNILFRHGGLGAIRGTGRYNKAQTMRNGRQIGRFWGRNNEGNDTFPIFTIDEEFATEAVAFMHLDVEGAELDVLKGASMVIARDHPMFTVESHFMNIHEHKALLNYIRSIGYMPIEINERCGQHDCRNYIVVETSDVSRCMKFIKGYITNTTHE